MTRSRTLRAAAAVPALLLGLTACGGATAEPMAAAGQASVAPAADQTPAEGSWDERTIVGEMLAAAAEQGSAHVTLTATVGGSDVEGVGRGSFGDQKRELAMVMDGSPLGPQRAEVRVVGDVLYVSAPPLTPEGKFLQIEPGSASPYASMVEKMQGLDPADALAALEAGLQEVTFLGVETVDGEDLEHYRFTIDPEAALEAHSPDRARAKEIPETVEVDVWLDESALTRRIEADHEQSSMVLELSRWGEPVTVEAPLRRNILQAPAG